MTPFERACRALCLSDGIDPDRKYNSSNYGEDNAPYEYAWHEYQRDARVMLIALREPSEEMIIVGSIRKLTDIKEVGNKIYYKTTVNWQSMIDELLKQCDDIR